MEKDIYKELYYRAFNGYTKRLEEIKEKQQELEAMYLELSEEQEETKDISET